MGITPDLLLGGPLCEALGSVALVAVAGFEPAFSCL
jgi:hypothetical protein